jgi:hypothetical protein
VKFGRPAGALWLVSLATAAPAQASPAQPASAAAPAAALAPLLDQVMARVGSAPKESAEQGLFQRLAEQQLQAQKAQASRAAAASAPAKPTKTAARKPASRKAATPATAASAPAPIVPALAWAMEQLDPGSFAVLRPVPVGGSGALLRTGDVFVVQFSTSLPGHVRLENVDAKGQTADLGTYTVLVDQLNRLPRDKGIQLQGQPGMERLRFYFYPCLPAEAADKAWVAEFKDRLPACTTTPVAQTAGLGTNAGTLGTVKPRALVNLAQTDAHVAIAGSTDYQPGDVTLMEALIRHESRGHAR